VVVKLAFKHRQLVETVPRESVAQLSRGLKIVLKLLAAASGGSGDALEAVFLLL
jgi:hypothetical protein